MICYSRNFPEKQELPFKIIEEVLKPKATFPISEILKVENTNNDKLIIHFQDANKKATVWEFHCPTVLCANEWRNKIHTAALQAAAQHKFPIYQNTFTPQINNQFGGNNVNATGVFNNQNNQGGVSFTSGNNPQFVGPNAVNTGNMNFSFGGNNPNQLNLNSNIGNATFDNRGNLQGGFNNQSPPKNNFGGNSPPNTRFSPNKNNVINSPLKGSINYNLNSNIQPNYNLDINTGNSSLQPNYALGTGSTFDSSLQFNNGNQPNHLGGNINNQYGISSQYGTSSQFGNNGANLQLQGGLNRPNNTIGNNSGNQHLGANRQNANQYNMW
jgi:hypothetical protein